MPVAVCYFYVWSCCKKSLAPRFGARRQRRKRRRSACGTSHSVLDPPVACFWGVIRWSNPWGPRWSCWAKNLINILNIYSAIIVVIILSLCANLYSQNTFQERQREKQTCVFSNHSEPQSTQKAQLGATRQLEERIKKLQSEVEDPKVALAFAGWDRAELEMSLLIFFGDGNDGAWDVSDTNLSTWMYRHYV